MNAMLNVLSALIVLACVSCKSPAPDPFPKFRIGSSTLSLSNPPDFTEVSVLSPSLRKRAELFLPSTERFIALFVLNEEVQNVTYSTTYVPVRYIILSTPRHYESSRMSKSKFSKYRLEFKKAETDKKGIKDTQDNINAISDADRTSAGLPKFKANIQGMTILDYQEENDSTFSLLYNLSSTTKYDTHESTATMASSASGLLLKKRILHITVHSRLYTDIDREWVNTTTSTWLSSLRNYNQ